jgi:hypothetical protein
MISSFDLDPEGTRLPIRFDGTSNGDSCHSARRPNSARPMRSREPSVR